MRTTSHWATAGADVRTLRSRLLADVSILAGELAGGADPDIVAFAFPGPIDAHGRARAAPTVWGEQRGEPLALGRWLQQLWPRATTLVLNDVTAAGYFYGSKLEQDPYCVVTVSSGIGNKVFAHGRPLIGGAGRGGEIGHFRVDPSPDANVCECGGRGHLGAVASGRGVVMTARRRAHEMPESFRARLLDVAQSDSSGVSAEIIADAFHAGDPWATMLVREAAAALGSALAAIHVAVGVEAFVVMGGFALALGERYREMLASSAASACWNLGQDWREMVVLGEPQDQPGLVGAGIYATQVAQ